jgi:hypothetical protein
MRVKIYRNLHKSRQFNVWSLSEVTGRHCALSAGKIVGYADVALLSDVCFVVNLSGRARVLRERKKYVHAYVEGELLQVVTHPSEIDPLVEVPELFPGRWVPVTYNPYKYDTFVRADTGTPVAVAKTVAVTPSSIMAQTSGLKGPPAATRRSSRGGQTVSLRSTSARRK